MRLYGKTSLAEYVLKALVSVLAAVAIFVFAIVAAIVIAIGSFISILDDGSEAILELWYE